MPNRTLITSLLMDGFIFLCAFHFFCTFSTENMHYRKHKKNCFPIKCFKLIKENRGIRRDDA